jgi:hypothetical protein
MLTNWNFKDEAPNSTTQQINRQKSARNLEVIQFDPSEPRAVFFDPKRGTKHTATLSECDCPDFNLAGTNPRKVFKPCMHIYRLAIELGLIEAKYLDHQGRYAAAGISSHEETLRLQQLPFDTANWGGWASEIHKSGIQRNRQYRGYAIIHDEQDAISQLEVGWAIHGYNVTLDRCECMDFSDRKLPCKHIYAAALASKIILPLGEAEYETARQQGLEIVFEFPATAKA